MSSLRLMETRFEKLYFLFKETRLIVNVFCVFASCIASKCRLPVEYGMAHLIREGVK